MANFVTDKYDTKNKVNFFYHEFKPKEANPEGFQSKLKDWIKYIGNYCESENKITFTVAELREAFELYSIKPAPDCLRLVLGNMLKQNQIVPLQDFYQSCASPQSAGWFGWGVSSVKKIWSWSLSEDTEYSEKVDDTIGEKSAFLHLKVVNEMSKKIYSFVESQKMQNQCLKFSIFAEEIASELMIDSANLELVILNLENKRQCVRVNKGDDCIIKFGQEVQITQKDQSLFKLEAAKQLLLLKIEDHEREMDKCKKEARIVLKTNNKIKTMQILRRKKRLENLISEKQNQLDNIEMLEGQIINADSNKMIMDAFSKSAQVLKSADVIPDDVDDVLMNIQEAAETHKNMMDTISKPVSSYGDVDDDELEAELKELVAEEEEDKLDSKLSKSKKNNAFEDSADTQELLNRLQKLRESPNKTTSPTRIRIGLDDDL